MLMFGEKDIHVHIRFPDLEEFIREIRNTLLCETGQLTLPKDCEFRVHPEDVKVRPCPDGGGTHIVVVMNNLANGRSDNGID